MFSGTRLYQGDLLFSQTRIIKTCSILSGRDFFQIDSPIFEFFMLIKDQKGNHTMI